MDINQTLLPALILNDTDTVLKFMDNAQQYNPDDLNQISIDLYLIPVQKDNAEVLEVLLHYHDISLQQFNGQYIIHHCVRHGALNCVKMLIARNLSIIQQQNSLKQTPAHVAAIYGELPILELLLSYDMQQLSYHDIYNFTVQQYREISSNRRVILRPIPIPETQENQIAIPNKFNGNHPLLYESQTQPQCEELCQLANSALEDGFKEYSSRVVNNAPIEDDVQNQNLRLSQNLEHKPSWNPPGRLLSFRDPSQMDLTKQQPKLSVFSNTLIASSRQTQQQSNSLADGLSNNHIGDIQFDNIDLNEIKQPIEISVEVANKPSITGDLERFTKQELISIIDLLQDTNKQLHIDMEKTNLVNILSNGPDPDQSDQIATMKAEIKLLHEQLKNMEQTKNNASQLENMIQDLSQKLELSQLQYNQLEKQYQQMIFENSDLQEELLIKQLGIDKMDQLLKQYQQISDNLALSESAKLMDTSAKDKESQQNTQQQENDADMRNQDEKDEQIQINENGIEQPQNHAKKHKKRRTTNVEAK